MLRAAVVGLVLGVALSCAGTTPPKCPAPCGGCCTSEGQCVADCGETLPPTCSPTTCAGCCWADGTCNRSQLALSCGGASCTSCTPDAGAPDPRCSTTNCAALLGCRVELQGEPRYQQCARADGGVPPGLDPNRFCPALCNAGQAGDVLACAANLSSQCADAGSGASDLIAAQCIPPSDAGVDPTCASTCDQARTSCDLQAPMASFDACMASSLQCGLRWTRCTLLCHR